MIGDDFMNKYLLMMLLPIALTACTKHGDLQRWMQDEKNKAAANVQKAREVTMPEVTPYEAPEFVGLNAFDPTRLSLARSGEFGPNAPDFNRPKEILENFGLDRVEYVAYYEKKGQPPHAYVRVDGHTYTVKVGNHIGTDFGEITEIHPDRIVLDETVQNAESEWIHRTAEVPLFIK